MTAGRAAWLAITKFLNPCAGRSGASPVKVRAMPVTPGEDRCASTNSSSEKIPDRSGRQLSGMKDSRRQRDKIRGIPKARVINPGPNAKAAGDAWHFLDFRRVDGRRGAARHTSPQPRPGTRTAIRPSLSPLAAREQGTGSGHEYTVCFRAASAANFGEQCATHAARIDPSLEDQLGVRLKRGHRWAPLRHHRHRPRGSRRHPVPAAVADRHVRRTARPALDLYAVNRPLAFTFLDAERRGSRPSRRGGGRAAEAGRHARLSARRLHRHGGPALLFP